MQDLITYMTIESQKFDTNRPGQWINSSAPSIPDVFLEQFLQY